MEANELRIGNFIQLYRFATDNEMTVHSVIGIDDTNVEIEDYFVVNHSTGISPIPLTEEWLLKFGFEEKPKYSHPKYWKGDYFCNLDGEFYVNNQSYEGETLSTNIRYVHQLQNLYFALTGEELTLKEAL